MGNVRKSAWNNKSLQEYLNADYWLNCSYCSETTLQIFYPLSLVNYPHKGQWHRALMFSLICVWINDWVNNHEAGDLRCYHTHYNVIVMFSEIQFDGMKTWEQVYTWLVLCCVYGGLTRGWDKMADIFQMTFSDAFTWLKMYELRLSLHWNLTLRDQLQYPTFVEIMAWHQIGNKPLSEPILIQFLMHKCIPALHE